MANRISTYTMTSRDGGSQDGEPKRNLWTSMLESVASGKRLPEKNLLVMGGTPESQREFLESLSGSEPKRNFDRQKIPPIANNYALGYTYYDVLDADQDDTLARVSLYLLSQPSGEFASLVAPLLTPETIPNTALVILLDWSQPHLWLRQIWTWLQVFQEVLEHLSRDVQTEMEDVMNAWKERGRGSSSVNLDGTPSATVANGDSDGSLPLGPGEWTEPLGLPLCVVCQNSTTSQLPILIHSTLGITSLLKRQPLKHNVIDRDKIVVPPNWDSWGKIRVLGGSFDTEKVSQYWSEDIKLPLGAAPPSIAFPDPEDDDENGSNQPPQIESAIALYEEWCRDPNSGGLAVVESAMNEGSEIAIESEDTQEFLERQLKILDAYKSKAPEKVTDSPLSSSTKKLEFNDEKTVNEHIGPVQFNMGGIQVDADDMLQRLKDRNAHIATDSPSAEPEAPVGNIAKDFDNEQLHDFFSGLMNRTVGDRS
ncbi:hypothetical protein ACHAPX_006269 [Trichoderma viride]